MGWENSGVSKKRLPAVETAKERGWELGKTVIASDAWDCPKLVVAWTPKFLHLKDVKPPSYRRSRLRSLPSDVREHHESSKSGISEPTDESSD